MTRLLHYGCGNPEHFRDNTVLPIRADHFAAMIKRWRCPTIVRGPGSGRDGAPTVGSVSEPCGAAIMLLGIDGIDWP